MTILNRIRIAAAICAALPLLLLAALLLRPAARTDPQAADALLRQVALPVEAQASAVAHRLQSVEVQVNALQAYAGEVLRSPEIYAGPQSRAAAISDGSAAKAADGSAAAKPEVTSLPPPGLDNPLVYTKGSDGAIRKLIDDGRPAAFFKARGGSGQFSVRDKQRLLASAALDPLLRQISKGPLAGQAFLLTSDSLLRTAPFRDLSAIPADRDLTQTTLYAWKADKAGSRGVVWTAPYASTLSGQWVIAALAGVEVGGRLIAVVGAEVPAKALQDNALSFPLGPGAVSWLQRADGVLVAAPASAETDLGIKPLAAAALPDDKQPGNKLLEASNLYLKGKEQVAKPLARLQSQTGTAIERVELTAGQSPRYIVTAPIEGTDLKLGALLASPLADSLLAQQQQQRAELGWKLTALLSTLALAGLLVLLVSWVAARRIAVPLRLLAAQVREAAAGRRRLPVALAEESEVGELSRAVQELIDQTAD